MIIDTDIYKSEKEIADMYGKHQPSIHRSIKDAAKKGKPVTSVKVGGVNLYDIRTLPESITKDHEKPKEEPEITECK